MPAFSAHFKLTPFIALSLVLSSPLLAADFTILDGVTVTTMQRLDTDGDTGVIEAGSSINTVLRAVNATANNNTVINRGHIVTSGVSGIGIRSQGADATITNSGSIVTSGQNALGIRAVAADATITHSGSIITSGKFGYGIQTLAANATITNSGSIMTSGDTAHGIRSLGANATITNSFSIVTSGDLAHGVYSGGADTTITNSSLISATGTNSLAILGASNDITLNLLPGSQIIGRIDLGDDGGDNDTANVYYAGVSANLTFENTENINLFVAGIVSGDTVVTVDATGESTRGVALAGMTSSIMVSLRRAWRRRLSLNQH
jgi:hypothetical protein